MALPKQHRLRHSRDFSAVYRHGRKAVSQHLVARVLAPKAGQSTPSPTTTAPLFEARGRISKEGFGPNAPSRFGISISQKVSKRAVVRNRIKRRIRAVIRSLLPSIQPGLQIVVIVRPGADLCEYGEFLRELEQLFSKLEVTDGRS